MNNHLSYHDVCPLTGEIRSGSRGGPGKKRHAVMLGGVILYCQQDHLEAALLAGRLAAAIQRDLLREVADSHTRVEWGPIASVSTLARGGSAVEEGEC